jgi:4-carboxymuconolactone decarboxylase
MSDEARLDAGRRVRRAVLGDAHVDRAESAATPFDAPFQQFITETAWGTLWADEALDRRTRSLITIAVLAALGRQEELALHLRATSNTGATPSEIRAGADARGRLRGRARRRTVPSRSPRPSSRRTQNVHRREKCRDERDHDDRRDRTRRRRDLPALPVRGVPLDHPSRADPRRSSRCR